MEKVFKIKNGNIEHKLLNEQLKFNSNTLYDTSILSQEVR